jgi:repressor LexA
MTKGLTDKQRAVFEFVCDSIRDNGCPPTVREVASHFGFRSPKAASDHLTALERKGYIKRAAGKARNIEVREELSPHGVPVLGKVPAGSPVMSLENLECSLSMADLFESDNETFALQVDGDSMVDAGILSGDYVVVSPNKPVQDGSIAAVRMGDKAAVKRVFFEGNKLRLAPENGDYDEMEVSKDADDTALLGAITGVLRKL